MADTDWTAAPEWATHVSKDAGGVRIWWGKAPVVSASIWGRWEAGTDGGQGRFDPTDGPDDGVMTLERRP